jgi:hypothetical protein
VCYVNSATRRSKLIAEAMRDGFKRHGIPCTTATGLAVIEADICVAYGWVHEQIFNRYRKAGGHYLYVDLGYWHRKPGGKQFAGYHKVSLDGWCPLQTMLRNCPADRFNVLNVPVKSMGTSGRHVVVAGMSAKSASDHGLGAESWERRAIATIKSASPRFASNIIYRPKPSWKKSRRIEGAGICDINKPIDDVLEGAHMLVTHHSNAAIDALVNGVPIYCEKGVGSVLSTARLEDVETPRIPTDSERMALLHDIAYTQFTPMEMRDGVVWDQYREMIK